MRDEIRFISLIRGCRPTNRRVSGKLAGSDPAAQRSQTPQSPHAHILHLKNETFSRDPNVVQALNDDPLVGQETQPSQTMAAMVRADERVKQGFPLITLPVLILHGTFDKNAKPTGSQLFYDLAGSTDKTLKLYDGSFHDPLNDLDKEVVKVDIKGWLNARLPATLETPAQSDGTPLQERLTATA